HTCTLRPPPTPTLFPYTTLFRSTNNELAELSEHFEIAPATDVIEWAVDMFHPRLALAASMTDAVLIDLALSVDSDIEIVFIDTRSEEHTSELQSRGHLVCRLLLE